MIGWYLDRLAARGDRAAFVTDTGTIGYGAFAAEVAAWAARLADAGLGAGDVVVVRGDHRPGDCALILALADLGAIAVPLAGVPDLAIAERCRIAGATALIETADGTIRRLDPCPVPPLVAALRASGRPGLILFSSGSAGAPKACLLDLGRLIETTREERTGLCTLVFLMFDHIGGINTVINILGHGGTAVILRERTVEAVTGAIARHGVELLPTSPTFLKMLLMSGRTADLGSLRMITYGTEPMPQAVLDALHAAFPDVTLKQTYGLSEVGIVPTRSRGPASLWMQIGGRGVEWRVVGGILHVRAPTAMLGYLNAPSPFDADGWLDTRDRVERDGDWLRILGRDSELISIGGEKVHPGEVEEVLLGAPNIADATVTARASPVTGNVLTATVLTAGPEPQAALSARLDAFCRARLEPFKVPARFRLADGPLHTARFKKDRKVRA